MDEALTDSSGARPRRRRTAVLARVGLGGAEVLASDGTSVIEIPADYQALRASDPDLAAASAIGSRSPCGGLGSLIE